MDIVKCLYIFCFLFISPLIAMLTVSGFILFFSSVIVGAVLLSPFKGVQFACELLEKLKDSLEDGSNG